MISSSSRHAGKPAAASAPITTGTSLALSIWIGDRLTATLVLFGQVAASAQAWRSTHSPIATIRPISSATGMNSAGEIMPRCGMVPADQRLAAWDAVVVEIEDRLIVQVNWPS